MNKLNMNKIYRLFFSLIFCLLLFTAGCGTGPDSATPTPTPPPPPTPTPASLDLLVSSQAINSSGTPTVTLTAIVKDSANRAMAGQHVDFATSSGVLIDITDITNTSGQATATLSTGGNKSIRTITLTATSGAVTNTNTVNVVGTTIDIAGPDSVGLNLTADYTITLKDSDSKGISGVRVMLTSQNNSLNPSTFVTDNSGQGTARLTATTVGADTLIATAIGATGLKAVTVSGAGENFSFTTPLPNAEINISTLTNVTIHYAIDGVPQAGKNVSFTTNRGTLSNTSATTDASGNATIQISSTTIGMATIAAVSGSSSTQVEVEFVAPTPATMTLQADPSVITSNIGSSTTQKSTLTATVRDAQNNLVKNQKINFTLLADPSVGYLSPATATTDSGGRASVLYIAGPATSGTNGVNIQATLEEVPAITSAATLTVGGAALFISIGTGPILESVSDQSYKKNYDILVTDSSGSPVPNAAVSIRLTPVAYTKGSWSWIEVGAKKELLNTRTLTSTHNTSLYADTALKEFYCLNEDMQYWNDPDNEAFLLNGIKDIGEDFNNNDALDPGTVAAVVPSNLTTDSNGLGTVGVVYTKTYATWVYVRLDVTVKAGGTEGKAHTTFPLPIGLDEYAFPVLPEFSPFGISTTCADTD